MPGPNLEIFRFTMYLFFPVYVMFKVGDPQWYTDHVIPYKDMLWPPDRKEVVQPRNQADLQAELAKYRAERERRKAALPSSAAAGDVEVGVSEGVHSVESASSSAFGSAASGNGSGNGSGTGSGITASASRWTWPSTGTSTSTTTSSPTASSSSTPERIV